jgi:hypothetical protein
MLTWRAWTSRGTARQQVLAVLLPACLVLGSIPLIFFFLCLTIELRPETYDALAYAADGSLGVQLSFLLGQIFAAVPALAAVSLLVYCTLPLAFMVILVMHLRGDGPPVLDIMPTFLCVAVSGFLMYLLFPLTGPLFAFADFFPHAPPPAAAVLAAPPLVPEVPRNCMPSLHTAWALLIWWHARPLARWVCVLAGVFLGFTLLATLGFGAHYAFDVVVAFPSTMAAQALCTWTPPSVLPRRVATVVLGVALTAVWLVLLRYGLALLTLGPPLTATAALATIVVSLARERALYRAAMAACEASCGPDSQGSLALCAVGLQLAGEQAHS